MNATPAPRPEAIPGPIYVLRHGAVALPQGGRRYVGWQDLALSDHGRRQARDWAARLAGTALEAIYCSPLSRCLTTARIIGDRTGHTPRTVPDLREINLGAWEGRRVETIRRQHPEAYARRGEEIADFRTPGGESFRDLERRAWPAFEAIAGRHRGPILIVTHAGTIRTLLCRLLGIPLQNLFRIGQATGTLTIVTRRGDEYCVQALNLASTGHPLGDG